MKTRCRSYGTRRRMTADCLPPSKQDSTADHIEIGGNLTEEVSAKDSEALHETRSQKQASKKRLQEDHADTTKDSSLATAPETANNFVGVATRSSTRPTKRIKLSNSSSNKAGNQDSNGANEGVTISTSPQANRRKKPLKRQWESWGKAEKDTFFEALHEYGKDFDKICNFIAAKHKRRGDPPALIKNKDQVRHFYYRTLNKIVKYLPADQLSENDSQKKMIIELRGLICYGELRKRTCGWNDKHGKKLEELLSHGTISIRSKGRNFKVRAPVCRALKRLTSAGQGKEDGDSQSLALPNKLTLEFLPHNHAAWAVVQRLSKNPRLRTSVSPKKPLSLMLNFLSKKWCVVSSKTLEPLDMCIVVPPDFYINSDVEKQTASPLCKPSSVDSCFVENVPTPGAVRVEDATQNSSPSSLVEEKCSGATDSGFQEILQEAPQEITGIEYSNRSCVPTEGDNKSAAVDNSPTDKSDSLSIAETCADATMASSSTAQLVKEDKLESSNKNCPKFWTSETCANITFGEIFCTLGRPPKLKLEYTWHDIEDNLAPSQTAVSLTKLVDVATVEFINTKESNRVSKAASKPTNSVSAKNSSQAADKEVTQKEKGGSKANGPATKTNHKLPFILPSSAPAAQTSKSDTVLSDLQTRPKVPRMQKRYQRPNVHRNILPRPVASPSSVPPGAVAVSFIPQPGQAVGTILAAGVKTSSVTMTSQSKATVSSKTTLGTAGCSDLSKTTSLTDNSSPQTAAAGASTEDGFSKTTSASLDIEMSGFSETDLLEVVDQFIGSSKPLTDNVASTSNSVDSIIGLALGSALDGSGTTTTIAGVNEDSNSSYLSSLLGLKPTNLDFTEQPIRTVDSHAALSISGVHIEELNSGVAGVSASTSITSPTLENILYPAAESGQCSASTASNVFFSITEPISSIVDSRSQQIALGNKETSPVSSLLLSPTSDGGLSSSIPAQWLNGESSNFSIGSLLDKLATSPRKEDKSVCLEESSGVALFKEPSQEPLISTHHLLDAETALHAMMDENSVDFVRKFQVLTKEMAGENSSKTTPISSTELTFPSLTSTEANSRSSDESNSDSLNFRSILRQHNMNGS